MTASAEAGSESFGTDCTARVNPGEGSIVNKRASPDVDGESVSSSAGTQVAKLAARTASEGLSFGWPETIVYLLF